MRRANSLVNSNFITNIGTSGIKALQHPKYQDLRWKSILRKFNGMKIKLQVFATCKSKQDNPQKRACFMGSSEDFMKFPSFSRFHWVYNQPCGWWCLLWSSASGLLQPTVNGRSRGRTWSCYVVLFERASISSLVFKLFKHVPPHKAMPPI